LPACLNTQVEMETLFHKRLPHKVKALSKWKSIDIQRINPDEPDYRRISSYLGKQTNLELIVLDPFNSDLSPRTNEKKSTYYYLPRRRRPAAPPDTAAPEEKPLPQHLSILQRSDCREDGAIGMCRGSQVKTITIRLPDVEAAMLKELKTGAQILAAIRKFAFSEIRREYSKLKNG